MLHRFALTAVVALVLAAPASRSTAEGGPDRALHRYATDTWRSFVAMTDADSGLPADSLQVDGTRSVQTPTTNIGAYMWSALVA